MNRITSPLRYPGGKAKVIKILSKFIPKFSEYREPFVGGGSVFIYLKQHCNRNKIFKINDLDYDVYCFWKSVRDNLDIMVKKIFKIKRKYLIGRSLYNKLNLLECKNDLFNAIKFFILNRITFSGLTKTGGYSEESFNRRFTETCIKRLSSLKKIMNGIIITNQDYKKLLLESGNNVFIYLDPPYFSNKNSKLYGSNGILHTSFDHERFANSVKKCKHKYLITYDDSPEIRDLFSFANIFEWRTQYSMNSNSIKNVKKARELLITNYRLLNFKYLRKFISID
ncbi:MAG: DNA adenine methylase, partial [Promethearchaeota archaeon]